MEEEELFAGTDSTPAQPEKPEGTVEGQASGEPGDGHTATTHPAGLGKLTTVAAAPPMSFVPVAGSVKHSGRCMKEWKMLESGLPEGIHALTFEDRLDLVRAVIVGPPDTPYEYLPFFFDCQFPADYPLSAPTVRYLSYSSTKIHPNLYVDGLVCLSLLGTWHGKGTESWVPFKSSLLQVFVSLQGLVLSTGQPYFLEAGFEKLMGTVAGERQSRLYNESALLTTLEVMDRTIRSPPRYFEDFVKAHFREHGPAILGKCTRLLEHANEEAQLPFSIFKPPSTGFLESLKNFLPRLAGALASTKE